MAKKRMFDKAIIDTDRFMDLSLTSKALYFLLGMEADDEGFVSYKKVMRVHGGNEDDIKVLVAKGFIIMFESGVIVITDWNKNNWLDSRRMTPTEYQKEKQTLSLTNTKEYVLSKCLASIEENSIEENSNIYTSTKENKEEGFEEFWKKYPKKTGKKNAFTEWKKISTKDKEEVMKDLIARKEDKKWIEGYIKDPERYLKYRQWEDEIIKPKQITNNALKAPIGKYDKLRNTQKI